ncbi:MAG: head-tail joining protein [Stenotrophomonas sp.]
MPGAGFRALAERMDALLVGRLGDPATLADGRPVSGAFASPFVGAEIGGGKGGAVRLGAAINADAVLEPTFTVRVVDVIGVKKGDLITIELPATMGGGLYKVSRLQPDGAGMVDLVLSANDERTDDIT